MELRMVIDYMVTRLVAILSQSDPTIYLYGSCTMSDFRLGWSDIDILVLTKKPISKEQAERLVGLRQKICTETGEPVYRCFEGGMLSLDAFESHAPDTVVYWGTSGERVTDQYHLGACFRKVLLDHGVLLYGEDIRDQLTSPSFSDLKANIQTHYEAIRKYAGSSGRSIYSFGWILDIARGIYTLRTGTIASKTAAGEWALRNHIFFDSAALEIALSVRKHPQRFQEDIELQDLSEKLEDSIQQYADILEEELKCWA